MRKLLLLAMMGIFGTSAAWAADFDRALLVEPFSLEWMNHETDGTMYNTDDYVDAVYVVEAYFKNCRYCNDNAPNVKALKAMYADVEQVQIVDVGRDCRASDYRTWIDRHSPTYPVLRDCDEMVLGQLGTYAYPSTYILDCNLNVVRSFMGTWSSSTMSTISSTIDGLMADGCTPELFD